MLNSYYIEKLLGLQRGSGKKYSRKRRKFEISIEQPRKTLISKGLGSIIILG